MNVNEIKTYELTVTGLVQGVGYRPFVAEVLRDMKLCGTVRNNGGIVKICITAANEAVDELCHRLYMSFPEGARIDNISVRELPYEEFTDVKIIQSDDDGRVPILPADICICENCIKELKNPANRRYRYPFISCAVCGPRYTIMHRIPYDRGNTTMSVFTMCDSCRTEYFKPGDRRYYAQTISCLDCGPQLFLKFPQERIISNSEGSHSCSLELGELAEPLTGDNDFVEDNNLFLLSARATQNLTDDNAFEEAVKLIKNGEVLAVKNTGGYHLVCDAFSDKAVKHLRELKKRDKKPFAVMFPSADEVIKYAELNSEEKELLEGTVRPVVLLKRKKAQIEPVYEVGMESPFIGAMLPSNGLQYMLAEEFPLLVMTSANISGEPMITDDTEIECFGVPVLGNDREILTPVDDSVVRVLAGKTQVLRRGRGYVPLPIETEFDFGNKAVFASGADMKSAFAYGVGKRVYLSQYLGDLSHKRVREEFFHTKKRMEDCFNLKAEKVVCDKHPLYFSVKAAKEFAKKEFDDTQYVKELVSDDIAKEKINHLIQVNHHFSHMAAVMAEHGIDGEAIGFSFDGTGYGEDGNVWGGELLYYNQGKFERAGHLMPVTMTGGDEGALNAELSLAAYLYAYLKREGCDEKKIGEKKADEKASLNNETCDMAMVAEQLIRASGCNCLQNNTLPLIFKALDAGINTITQTSAGRLFDAVAALLGICTYNGYEGQCPCELEYAAYKALDTSSDLRKENSTEKDIDIKIKSCIVNGKFIADTPKLIYDLLKLKGSVNDTVKDTARIDNELAEKFHSALARWIGESAEYIAKNRVQKDGKDIPVILSGGTFANRMLTEKSIEELTSRGFKVYVSEQLPSGDDGIALGQLFMASQDFENKSLIEKVNYSEKEYRI